MSLNAGDVVRLKSGGPLMTIVRVLGPERIVCNWFVDDARKDSAEFPEVALKLHEEKSREELEKEVLKLWD